jgi:hypothetical protein
MEIIVVTISTFVGTFFYSIYDAFILINKVIQRYKKND